MFDPASLDLEKLFRDPDMFASRDDWGDAGFQVVARSHDSKIMVASHASVEGFLFKKYTSDVSLKEQHANYVRRIKGARELRSFLDAQRFRRVTVPQKWLYELPHAFCSRGRHSYVLVVERLDILDEEGTKQAYHRIDDVLLRELSAVVFKFKGLDSNAKNLPFTKDGRVAFVDTEHWDRHLDSRSRKPCLRHVYGYLSSDRLKRVKRIFEELEHTARR